MGSYLHRRPLQHSLTSVGIIILIIIMIAIIMMIIIITVAEDENVPFWFSKCDVKLEDF